MHAQHLSHAGLPKIGSRSALTKQQQWTHQQCKMGIKDFSGILEEPVLPVAAGAL